MSPSTTNTTHLKQLIRSGFQHLRVGVDLLYHTKKSLRIVTQGLRVCEKRMQTVHYVSPTWRSPTNLIALADPLVSVLRQLLVNVLQLHNHHLRQLVQMLVLGGQSYSTHVHAEKPT